MKSILFTILSIVFFACSNQPITITKNKIVNENWNPDPRKGRNGMIIQKVTVANDSLDYYLEKGFLTDTDFRNNPSFHYKADFGKREVKEVHFDTKYDWKWIDVNTKNEVSKIGLLKNGTWYKFSGLTNNTKFFLYVYVDEKGLSHQYSVNRSNY